MARILVVYYSRTGTTRDVGRQIARELDADVEEIADPTPRAGVRGFVRSAIAARLRRRAPIAPSTRDPADYDLVVIGTPVWAASITTPVRAWVHRHKNLVRQAAFFCTHGSSGAQRALAQLAAELGLPPAARLVVRAEELSTTNSAIAIDRFVARVRDAAEPHPEVTRARG